MQIHFKKGSDGPDVLHCMRDDGTQTWAPLQPTFGPMHDLGHFVVETALGLRGGFYGLLARGFDLSSFEEREARSRIEEEGLLAETLVMALQYELAGFAEPEAYLASVAAACRGLSIAAPELAPGVVEHMRDRFRELWARWEALPPGGRLTLVFEPERRPD